MACVLTSFYTSSRLLCKGKEFYAYGTLEGGPVSTHTGLPYTASGEVQAGLSFKQAARLPWKQLVQARPSARRGVRLQEGCTRQVRRERAEGRAVMGSLERSWRGQKPHQRFPGGSLTAPGPAHSAHPDYPSTIRQHLPLQGQRPAGN